VDLTPQDPTPGTRPLPPLVPAKPASAGALRFLFPGWYAVVMGLCGLSLAWHRAQPLMGDGAALVAVLVGVVAALVFAVLAVATLLRARRHPEAWAEDRRHPVRHTFIATLPVAVILLATVAVSQGQSGLLIQGLWMAGSAAQLGVTAWVLGRWWKGNGPGGLAWTSATPALFIPIVGNVLVPLAGIPLGHAEWSAAQFGVGLLFWPVVTILIAVRIATHGLWPDRLRPTSFIFIAPPAVVGLSALQFGAPPLVGWALWGMALFSLGWVGLQARQIAALPFGLPHWGLSFPLAALAALTLRVAGPSGPLATLGLLLLALASLVILALTLATVRGLRDGSLLAPEPVATLQPVAAG
jgi:tellurite resistance protein